MKLFQNLFATFNRKLNNTQINYRQKIQWCQVKKQLIRINICDLFWKFEIRRYFDFEYA